MPLKRLVHRCKFWADSETFNGDGEPMVIHKLVNDMRAVQPYVSSYLSFSFNHYMSPQQVNPLYYKTYMDYLASGKVESEPPTQPADLKAVAARLDDDQSELESFHRQRWSGRLQDMA